MVGQSVPAHHHRPANRSHVMRGGHSGAPTGAAAVGREGARAIGALDAATAVPKSPRSAGLRLKSRVIPGGRGPTDTAIARVVAIAWPVGGPCGPAVPNRRASAVLRPVSAGAN